MSLKSTPLAPWILILKQLAHMHVNFSWGGLGGAKTLWGLRGLEPMPLINVKIGGQGGALGQTTQTP